MRPVKNVKTFEPICTQSLIQDGNVTVGPEISETRGLFGDTGSKRRVFFSSDGEMPSKISSFHLEGPAVPVLLSSLQANVVIKSVHQGDETSYNKFSSPRDKSCSVSRRYVGVGSVRRGESTTC